jgi:hypothetical protein
MLRNGCVFFSGCQRSHCLLDIHNQFPTDWDDPYESWVKSTESKFRQYRTCTRLPISPLGCYVCFGAADRWIRNIYNDRIGCNCCSIKYCTSQHRAVCLGFGKNTVQVLWLDRSIVVESLLLFPLWCTIKLPYNTSKFIVLRISSSLQDIQTPFLLVLLHER